MTEDEYATVIIGLAEHDVVRVGNVWVRLSELRFRTNGNQARLAISAPKSVRIQRQGRSDEELQHSADEPWLPRPNASS